MNGVMTGYGAKRWLIVLVAAMIFGMLTAGCGRREEGVAREAHTNSVEQSAVRGGGNARGNVAAQTAELSETLTTFDTRLHAEEILTALISRETTNGLDFESVSNAVAGIDSETILKFGEANLTSRWYDNPRTIAIAQMFEVVAARAEPASSRMYALLRLYQLYHEFNAARGYVPEAWVDEKLHALRALELSANPSEAERATYSTIQGILVMGENDPAREVEGIRRLRRMQEEGIICLPKQWMDMNERSEIRALLELKQGKEAYEKMKASFEKHTRGELDPSVWRGEDFTDFETGFEAMSNLYYGAPLRREMAPSTPQ